MPTESSDKKSTKHGRNRNRRRGSRKRARSQEQKTIESDSVSRQLPSVSTDDNINRDDKSVQRNQKLNSTMKDTKMVRSNQNKKNRRPSRKNMSQKSVRSTTSNNAHADTVNCDNEVEDDNSCARSKSHDQNQRQSSTKANHLDINMADDDMQILCWNSPFDFVPIQSEEAIVKVMLPRGKRERGMMRNYTFRLKEIKQALKSANGMTLKQALSLRRLHIKNFNPTMTMSRLGLGEDEDIRQSAIIFEECIQEYLDQNSVQYWTEKEQKERANEDGSEGPRGTPDFLLRHEVMLRKVRAKGKNLATLEERKIHWLEAKMFYGASTIPQGGGGAVGSLVSKMCTYVSSFGEGAIVFMNGCGDTLASELNNVGVTVLDCADTIRLGRVVEHQKTWCASRDGRILN